MKTYKQILTEDKNPIDTITMDVPLFIRLLELSREEIDNDMDLHKITEAVTKLSKSGNTITMNDYDQIIKAIK